MWCHAADPEREAAGVTQARIPHAVVERIERAEVLDGPAKEVGRSVRSKLAPGPAKDAVSGTWLGHALHPLLTDVVIGTWLSALLLDLAGGEDARGGADRLLAVGLLAYPPTAFTGASDWADTEVGDDGVRRIGFVHAGVNALAFTLQGVSLASRLRGRRGRGVVLSLTANAVLGAGGWLGGHMSYAQGVGVDQTVFDTGPDEWTAALPAAELVDGAPVAVVVGETPVLLVRAGGAVRALHDRCSHRGCSLAGGTVDGDVVECPCHGSRFRLADGAIERGPATAPQPAFEVREQGGQVEVRLRA
jgi:nitrite reductase/ring-hydroxylating ferredoxin subunit/uncharacterized membrane protein